MPHNLPPIDWNPDFVDKPPTNLEHLAEIVREERAELIKDPALPILSMGPFFTALDELLCAIPRKKE